MLSKILERFVEESPITVMAQTLMSRIFAPDAIDALFEKYAKRQYQQDLLFSSEHRLKVTRDHKAAPLPGKALVVFDPISKLVLDILCEEDGYTQERALFPSLLFKVKPKEVWMADRNFCTAHFLTSIDCKKAFFVIREHKSLPYTAVNQLKPVGEIKTLAYLSAALFSYSMALVTYNILATIKYILGVVHAGLSDYYLVDEIQSTYRGMIIAVGKDDWQLISRLELSSLIEWLNFLASNVYLKGFRKTPRGIKKPKPTLKANPKRPHISTARLLREN